MTRSCRALVALAALAALAPTAAPAAAAPPANDAFAAAQPVGLPQSLTATNAEATTEAGEPAYAGVTGGHSVWFRFSSSAGGRLKVNTCATGLDTAIAVYTGSSVGALTAVTSNDNACGVASQVIFDFVAATTYYIAVDGAGGATGEFGLLVDSAPTPPPPPPTCPPAGTPADEPVYRGTHAQGGAVCLTLKPDFSAVTGWVVLDVRENDTGGCVWPVSQRRYATPIPIAADRSFDPKDAIIGSFGTEQTAAGTLRITSFSPLLYSCSSPLLTWSATTTSRFAFAPPPPPPPPPPAPDTRAPALRLGGNATQRSFLRRGYAAVTATCPDEACVVKATGALATADRASQRLRSARRSLAAGRRATLKLWLPQAARRPVARALRAGRRLTARITVAAADAAGNRTTRTRTVRLRR